jgi:hypothetical protein
MASPLRWWVIPAALIVMARVVMLGAPGSGARDAKDAAKAVCGGAVLALDAAVRRGIAPAADDALTLHAPAAWRGRRVQLRVWRRVAAAAEPVLWLEGTPRLGRDGSLVVEGLGAGRYDVEVGPADGGAAVRLVRANDVDVPGTLRVALPE